MTRWEDWREYRATRMPAPEHGIKVKKAGTTWWGQRWIEALQHVLQGDAGRLERGRSYARAGRAHDLELVAGKVMARVTGTRPTPYQVVIELTQLSDAVWQGAIAAMATQAQFSAELLMGEMPRAIDEAFHAAGSSLFPEQRSELATSCSCPDWGDPCKHVAATHYVLGDAFDRDPFLLFELRGRSRERVLQELRQARGGPVSSASSSEALAADPVVPTMALSAAELADYDRPRATLPALRFSFEAPASHAAVLRQLGVPATWRAEGSPADALAPLLQKAADAARRLALAPPAADEPAADQPAAEQPLPPQRRLLAAPPPARRRAKKAAPAPRSAKKKKSRRPARE